MRAVGRMRLVDRRLAQALAQGGLGPLNLQQSILRLRNAAAGTAGAACRRGCAQCRRARSRARTRPGSMLSALLSRRFLVRPRRENIGKAVVGRRGPGRIFQPACRAQNAHNHDGSLSVR